jgi:superfamily I DNA and/or RNA helicase
MKGSRSNAEEAEALLSCLLYLHQQGNVPLSSMGVITPYVAQVQLISDKLTGAGIKANRAVLQEDERGVGRCLCLLLHFL